jgi:hypothetical protein
VGQGGFGRKNPDWHARELVVDVRREWAECQNRFLERYAPKAQKVSEKSLAEQGLDRQPTEHKGPEVTAMERRGQRTERGENNRDIEAENRGREREARRLDTELADAWLARQWTARPTDEVVKEMELVRASMARQREAWRQDRDAIAVTPAPSVRKLEAELTRREATALRRAERQEVAAKTRAEANGVPLRRIAQWGSNPGRALMRSLLAWNEDLDRIAKARGDVDRARRVLEARRAWTKSDAGRTHIQNLREPAIEAARVAKSQRRTLDRKIKRMDKRLEEADREILRAKVVKRLGHEQLRVPREAPGRSRGEDTNARRYFRFMGAEARIAFSKAPEQDVKTALKFIGGLAPGAPIPSVRPASPTPDIASPLASGRGPKAPDLPEL